MRFRVALLTFSFAVFSLGSVVAKQLSATFDYCNFKSNDSLGIFEYYLSFEGNSLNYVPSSAGGMQGKVRVYIFVMDKTDTIFFDKFDVSSPLLKDSSDLQKEFLVQNRLQLPNGNLRFSLEARDLNAQEGDKPLSLLIGIKVGFSGPTVQISDIQTLKEYSKSNEVAGVNKSGFSLISRNSIEFTQEKDIYKFYSEIYNTNSVMGDEQPFLVWFNIKNAKDMQPLPNAGSFAKYDAKTVNPVLGEIDLSQVPTGEYYFVVDVRNRENESLASKKKYFSRYHPSMAAPAEEEFDPTVEDEDCEIAELVDRRNLNFILQGLMPMAQERENDFIDAVVESGDEEQKIKYLCYFFKKRATLENPATAQYINYRERLEVAEKKYATQTMPGYQTDRGRVLIQYGKPNRIDDEWSDPARQATNNSYIPYEIWTYYKVESPIPQTNITFVFAQRDRANFNYQLVHSNGVGERQDPAWREDIRARYIIDQNPSIMPDPAPMNDGGN